MRAVLLLGAERLAQEQPRSEMASAAAGADGVALAWHRSPPAFADPRATRGDLMTIFKSEERTVARTRWNVDGDETSVAFAATTFWQLTTVRGRVFGRSRGERTITAQQVFAREAFAATEREGAFGD
jgi:hypothetical protein